MALNEVNLIGFLGQDPDVRYMPDGKAVANISVATTDKWRDKNTGEQKELTEWHRVVIFGKLAEVVGEYLKKGSQVYIKGKLRTRKWQDQNGVDRYTTEIVVDMNGQMQMLGNRQGNAGQPQNAQNSQPANQNQQNANQYGGYAQQNQGNPQQKRPQASQSEPPLDFDDDIPF